MLDHQHEEMGRAAGVEPSFRAFTEHPRYRTSTHAIVRGAGIEPALTPARTECATKNTSLWCTDVGSNDVLAGFNRAL
jgi:hypothetical protein